MGLIAPAFLAGLAALAVPLLLHLAERSEQQGRRFPSLMFVRRVAFRTRRRRSLRDRLLLALRCLALALLALAFARPFLAGQGDSGFAPPVDLVLLLDRSYSMGLGERWPRALAAAGTALDTLPAGARAAVLLFDTRPEVVQPLGSDLRAARGALQRAAPGLRGTDFATAVARAGELLAASPAARRQVVLVSDLQQVGLLEGAPLRLPEGVDLEVVGVAGDDGANVTLAPLGVLPGDDVAQSLAVTVHAGADHAPGELRLALALDGDVVDTQPLQLAAGETRRLRLPLPAPSREPLRVSVRLLGDTLAADDEQRLVLGPARPLRVLLVEQDGDTPGAGLFLQRALAVAAAPPVQLRRAGVSELTALSLDEFEVLVLDDLPALEPPLMARLRTRVEQGAGLLVVAGERAGEPPAAADWLPAWPGAVRTLDTPGGLRILWTEDARRLAAVLADDGDAAPRPLAAAVQRHRTLVPRAGDQVWARLENGAPLLLARDVGAGRAALVATTFDGRWNALPRSPQFAPLVIALVRELAARGPARAAFVLGDVVPVAEHAGALGLAALAAHLRAGGGAIVASPDGRSTPLAEGSMLLPESPGFYEVHATGGVTESLPLAVNVDTRESDAAVLQAEAVHQRLQRESLPQATAEAAAIRRLAEQGRDGAWWWLLLAASVLFVIESLLARRLARRRLASGGAT